MDALNPGLSHLDENGLPKMVDVSAKPETVRRAEAEAVVTFPEEAWSKLAKDGFTTKKGGIFDVAITAGTMALKKTSETIPLFGQDHGSDGCRNGGDDRSFGGWTDALRHDEKPRTRH
jgi:hypothetical protein